MKKLFWLLLTFVYLITSSSLVHASTMWFFDMSHTSHHHKVSHCHTDNSSKSQKKSTQNMNCCELFSSNQYSQAKLDLKTSKQYFHSFEIQKTKNNDIWLYGLSTLQTSDIWLSSSPWWQTAQGKYIRFSDLFGIIEKTL